MRCDRTTALVPFLLLALLLLFTFFYKLSYPPLYIWDEARRANDALQMYLRGDFIINHYDDNPQTWGVKSPILLWLQVACMHLFGVGEFAVRFPSAVASFLLGSCIWLFCTRYFGKPWLGFLSGAVFGATYAWVFNHAGRTGDYDALLSLFSFIYALSFYAYCSTKIKKWFVLFWVFLTAAVLIKGAAGLFFLPGLALFALLQKHLFFLLKQRLQYAGALCFITVISGYYLFREWYAPGFLAAVNNNELGGRYLTGLEGHGLNFLYYFKVIVAWRYTYWIPFLIPAFILGFLHPLQKVKTVTLFNFILTAVFLIIISTAQTKLSWYELPVYPFWAVQIGLLLFYAWQWMQTKYISHFGPFLKYGMATLLLVLLFAYPLRAIYVHHQHIHPALPWDVHVQERRQAFFLQQAIRRKMDLNNFVFFYEAYDRHIHFYVRYLQSKNVKVQLVNTIEALAPGVMVVVSEDSTAQKLVQHFKATPMHMQWGCAVYSIQNK